MSKMGDGFCPKDEQIILNALQTWVGKKEERERLENALNKDEAMLSIATRVYQNEFNNARTLWSEFGNSSEIEDHSDALLALAQTMSEYLSKRSALDSLLREKRALIKSLSTELERFSEADIRARITPEIKEKIKYNNWRNERMLKNSHRFSSRPPIGTRSFLPTSCPSVSLLRNFVLRVTSHWILNILKQRPSQSGRNLLMKT
jgi:hypothetical protein